MFTVTNQLAKIVSVTNVSENTAKANELMGKSLEASPALIEKLKVEKWDGHYPTYMMGNAMPMIQISASK